MKKLTPNKDLTDEALAEWGRVTKELATIDGLQAADRATVTLWCKTWMINRQCFEHVAKFGPILPAINKSLGRSPWYQVYIETTATLAKLADQLGITRKARDYDKVKAEPQKEMEIKF